MVLSQASRHLVTLYGNSAWHRIWRRLAPVSGRQKHRAKLTWRLSQSVFWICASELPQRTGTIMEGQTAILLRVWSGSRTSLCK